MSSAKHYACSVTVDVIFIPEQSDITLNRYTFAYHVKITNTGNIAAQLISRHWLITEANGTQQEVRGLGVIGVQPLLNPRELFEYNSGTVMSTPMGKMQGSYQMVAEDGKSFEVAIAPFELTMPRILH